LVVDCSSRNIPDQAAIEVCFLSRVASAIAASLANVFDGCRHGFVVRCILSDDGQRSGHQKWPPSTRILHLDADVIAWLDGHLAVLLIAIVYGVKPSRGEWAEYPVLGRLSRKILKLGPGGAPA
jgi:hypothetical protein